MGDDIGEQTTLPPLAPDESPSVEASDGPTADVVKELTAYLEGDDSRLGEVYRGLQRGLAANEIAEELEVSTAGFVSNNKTIIRALLEGQLPTSPTTAVQTARRLRTIARTHGLSRETHEYLDAQMEHLESLSVDPTARAREIERAKEQTNRAEATNRMGIYVYALPHYLRYPFDERTGKTLMKVGRSDSDIIQRFRHQTRTTALPEEPLLLRIYPTQAQTLQVEQTFHRLLQAADMSPVLTRSAGREWFITSLRFLDEVARTLQLPIEIVNDFEDAVDES